MDGVPASNTMKYPFVHGQGQGHFQYLAHPAVLHELSPHALSQPFDEHQFDNYEGPDGFRDPWHSEDATAINKAQDQTSLQSKLGRKERMLDFTYDPATGKTYPDPPSVPSTNSGTNVGSIASAAMGQGQASASTGSSKTSNSKAKEKAILAAEATGGCVGGGFLAYGGYKAVQKLKGGTRKCNDCAKILKSERH